jgi:nicotinamidase/pyrazinamidase
MKRALLVIDIQNDFLPGGALAVRCGDEVIDVANKLIKLKNTFFDFVIASQDTHPAGHKSFATQYPGKKPGDVIDLNGNPQVLWPDHCVLGTHGSEFPKSLLSDQFDAVFRKGLDPQIDSYSAFFDNTRMERWMLGSSDRVSGDTGLNGWLTSKSVTRLVILGLATDYCVLFSVLDALKLGYDVSVVQDSCRGVDIEDDDSARAFAKMQKSGARLVTSSNLNHEQV